MTDATKYFFELTPERILQAVERTGLKCTGRCLQLNSMENRVFEVEIDTEEEIKTPSDRFRVVKFYRPGRWSREQILEEHRFMLQLKAQEIPVVAPIALGSDETLFLEPHSQILYTLFPKRGGRHPDEFDTPQLERIGRLLARMHNVGASEPAPHRLSLTPQVYGIANLEFLLREKIIPATLANSYEMVVRSICQLSDPLFKQTRAQRIHGDCHCSNVLWGSEGPFLVDFDDMVQGPCVQDVWLLVPGRDRFAQEQRRILLQAYEQLKPFEWHSLGLIEALRALRFVHYSAWIARRWADPAFPRAFPHFGTDQYWREQTADLQDQLQFLQGRPDYDHIEEN